MAGNTPSTGLRSYDRARLVRGSAEVVARMPATVRSVSVRGFGAALINEGPNEYDVPPMEDHVLFLLQAPRGTVEGQMEGRRFTTRFRPWTTNLLPAGLPSWWRTDRHGGLNLHLHFDPAELAGWFGEHAGGAGLHPLLDRRDEVVRFCGEAILREMRDGRPGGRMMIEGLALQLGAHLLRSYPDRDVPLPSRGGLAPWQLRRVTEYMADHLADAVSLGDLAAIVGLSRFHFARAFKESTGLPPHRYQIGLRIERARMLLETTALPVADIAARVGYAAPQAFAQVFRRETGHAPSDWRRRAAS